MSTGTVILRICLIILIVETAIMFIALPLLGLRGTIGLSDYTVLSAIDAAVLLLVSSPLIYFFVVQPFVLARKRAESLLSDAIESIADGFMLYDADDRVVLCNERYREMFARIADVLVPGARFEDLLRTGVQRGQYPEAVGREEEWIAERLRQHRELGTSIERQLPDGRWVKIQETPTRDGSTVGVRTDITELKTRERQLRESEERLRQIVNSLQDGFVLYDAEDRLVLWNEKWLNLHNEVKDIIAVGVTFEQLIRASVSRKVFPEAIGREDEFIADRTARHRDPGEPIICQYSDNRWYIVRDVRTSEGGLFVISIDITDLKNAEAEIRRSERRIRGILESMPGGVITIDAKGTIKTFNPACESLFGYMAEDVVGRNVNILMPAAEASRHDGYIRAYVAASVGKAIAPREVVARRKDGTRFPMEIRVGEIKQDDTHRFVGVLSDITLRKEAELEKARMERRIRDSQKMESLGTLAGGIAHDLNNTLVPVLGLTNLVLERLPEDSEDRPCLETVIAAAERGRDLVSQILTFSRQADPNWTPVDLGSVVRETLSLLRATLPAAIEIHAEIDENMPPLTADATQIHQILMNLGSNASCAMGLKPGAFAVILKSVELDEATAAGQPGLFPGRYAKMTVSDTGRGMDEETLARVFDPFFTTKDVGEGTGLGLSVVHGIVTAHGGTLAISSEPGRGTVVEIFLPFEPPARQRQENCQAAE